MNLPSSVHAILALGAAFYHPVPADRRKVSLTLAIGKEAVYRES